MGVIRQTNNEELLCQVSFTIISIVQEADYSWAKWPTKGFKREAVAHGSFRDPLPCSVVVP